ncbi:hypothetical protein [Streptomyces venezuelae]|uniref:Uncharacterized protein n=1 Tax=Streptomyces venezuelae TaxID=54571 RepID=A0A5P2B7I5_STRVZ|nr:hypothetical protein [Streptomyces venezuelae]QES25860.1 hypothetical protein DEJ47_04785 [Streptomyces venezuelae]
MAIFGNDNADLLRQMFDQLGRIGTDLAALKQQAADQQLAIDQIRQDTTAAITTGLTENRAVIRDGLDRTRDTIGDPLTRISTELVAIRSSVNSLDSQLKARAEQQVPPIPRPAPESAPEPTPAPPPEPVEDADSEHVVGFTKPVDYDPDMPDDEILTAAAGVAHATLEAHRDTWAFLVQTAGNAEHFHIPGAVNDEDGFVEVRLSGPSLVAAIISLAHVTRDTDSPVTRAIAGHIQNKITRAVQAIIDHPRTNGTGTPVRITIDDQTQADEPEGGDERPTTGG